jgi:S-formylglutathione hydrolase FrmB
MDAFVGQDDDTFRPQTERVAATARGAGIGVSLIEVPGQHSWSVATEALVRALPWISARIGLLELGRA